MKEQKFQSQLIKKLETAFPGCIVIKNDPSYIQGIPDLLILYKDKWAALECKAGKNSHKQPNQEYYVNSMNDMSYASFIYPENEEDVINELQQTFKT